MEYEMSHIYKITNLLNSKSYIGKTKLNFKVRFKQHLTDSNKPRNSNRPLYRAINKYGKENFVVSLLEITDEPEEREIYWIKFHDTYNSGYNATLGGDGKPHVDEELVLFCLLNVTTNCAEVCRITEYSSNTVVKIAKDNDLYFKHTNSQTKLSKEIQSKILELYVPGRNGFGRRKIAKLLNISEGSICRFLQNVRKN